MSGLYEEYGLEMEKEPSTEAYNPVNKKKATAKKKSGGWFRTIIALGLGVVIGVGGVVGGGYLALTRPAGPTLKTVGGFVGINYEEQIKNKLLSEEYENKSILEIAKELAKVVKDKNLVGIANISPVVDEYVDKLVNKMNTEFGVTMDGDTLIETPFQELPAYLGDTFRTTPLGNMLRATSKTEELEPILMELCYGEEGTHYYIDENGEIVMNEGHSPATFETFGTNPNSMINNVSLAAVLPPNDSLMLSMAYGKEGITYELEKNEDGTTKTDENGHPIVSMLPMYYTYDGTQVYDYNGEVVECAVTTLEGSEFLQMVKAPAYDGAGENTYYLKEVDGKYYAYAEPSEEAAQVNFKKTMLGDLSEDSSAIIDNIYLKDALNVTYDPAHPENDPHAILFSLAYGTEGVEYTVDPVTKKITMIGGAHPRTIGDLREHGTDLINDVAISDIMSAKHDDSLSMYILYGKEGIHYALDEEDNLSMLQQFIAISDDGAKVYNEYGELLQIADGETKGYTLTETTFTNIHGDTYTYQAADPAKTIKTNDGQVKVYYLFNEDGTAAMFAKHSLGELAGSDNLISRLTDRLSLSEVLHDADLENNKFLKHVSDCPVNEIPDELLKISVTDMFSEEIYGANAVKYEGETPLTAVGGVVIENGDFYTQETDGYHKAEMKSTWKYLLTDPNGVMKPGDYKAAEDMDKLLSNMTANVESAKMRDLKNDEIIHGLSDEMLNTKVRDSIGGHTLPLPAGTEIGVTTMGDLTVTEMLNYTSAMISALNELGI